VRTPTRDTSALRRVSGREPALTRRARTSSKALVSGTLAQTLVVRETVSLRTIQVPLIAVRAARAFGLLRGPRRWDCQADDDQCPERKHRRSGPPRPGLAGLHA
jgi:hypothetical protein